MNWPHDGSHAENHHHARRLRCLACTAFALAGCASGNIIKGASDYNASWAPPVLNRLGHHRQTQGSCHRLDQRITANRGAGELSISFGDDTNQAAQFTRGVPDRPKP